LLQQTFLLQQDVALSQNLSALGAAGLEALEYLDKGQPEPESWKTQQVALINQAKQRSDDLLLMVVAPVEQLVEAGGTSTPHN
jgi:hypothetical protein